MQPFLILHTSCRTFSITFLLKVFKLRSCQKMYGLLELVVESEEHSQ